MQNLKATLIKKLKGAGKIAVIGIGSTLRNDDAAGILVAEKLEKINSNRLKVFIGSTAPENLTGEIISYNPSHIFIIDSADTDQKPGFTMLIGPEDVGGVSFSSHMLPVKIMVDYLLATLNCEIIVAGIQPKSLEFGETVSDEVSKSVNEIVEILKLAI